MESRINDSFQFFTKSAFDKMLEILEQVHKELHKAGGRPQHLSVLEPVNDL
ncbi:MAG: hypothetical protein LBF32_04075 [Streptococcaceae bacterium]|jgi:hypothetical protein|nr:hypothetical protein [Streptococcaceae bacterium]